MDVLTRPEDVLKEINTAVKDILQKAGLTGRDLLELVIPYPPH